MNQLLQNKKNVIIILFIIVLVGGFLRLQNFEERLRFNNDQVRDAKIVNNMITNSEFPLLGPKAGGTTFKLGPAYYYLSYASGKIFGNTPTGIALFIPIFGTLSIALFYFFLRNSFQEPITLGLTFLYATSFFAIKYSSFAWNPNAISFFLLLFLLALIKLAKKPTIPWFAALGISMGIGMQLHTTLLIIFPATAFIFLIILLLKKKTLSIYGIAVTFVIAFILLSPMFTYDIRNNWENTRGFFAGTETKSADETNIFERIISTTEFYVKGTSYTLTSFEAQRNWLHPKKLLLTKSFTEITTLALGSLFFFFSLCLLCKKDKKVTNNIPLMTSLLIIFLIQNTLLFFLLAEELNIRFFIILLPLPYILLGLLLHKIHENLQNKDIYKIIFGIILATLFSLNMITYYTAYDFSKPHKNKSLYGGISVSEIQKIIDSAKNISEDKTLFILPHKYDKSIKYFASKNSITLKTKSPKNIPENSLVLFLSDKPKENSITKKYQHCFEIKKQDTLGRLRLFTLRRNSESCQ